MELHTPLGAARWRAPSWSGQADLGRTALDTGGRRMVMAGIVAAVAVPVIVTVDTLTRTDGYDGSTHWISLLSHGDRGWIERIVLLAAGTFVVVGGVGLVRQPGWPPTSLRRTARSAVALGAGLVLAAVFRIDVVPSYPAGSPEVAVSIAGVVHAIAGCVIVGSLVMATVYGRGLLGGTAGDRAWRSWSVICAASVIGPMAICTVKAGTEGGNWELARAGACQRVALFVGLSWLATAGVVVLRRRNAAPDV